MQLRDTIYTILIEIAQSDSDSSDALITYGQLASQVGMLLEHEGDVKKMADLLGDISRTEFRQDRPLLSVIVVQGEWAGNPQQPGDGFFRLARELGVYKGKTEIDNISFFAQELRKVQNYWQQQKS